VVALPDLDEIPRLFAGLGDAAARIARLVATTSAIYERGADDLRAALHEPDVHPAVAEAARHLDAVLGTLVDTALAPPCATVADHQVARAMIDLATWKALRDQGLDADQAREAVTGMLTARATSGGRHAVS